MLRRRNKGSKFEKKPTAATPAGGRSRRRARPDAVVPAELIVRDHHLQEPAGKEERKRPPPSEARQERRKSERPAPPPRSEPPAPVDPPQPQRPRPGRHEPVVLVTGFECFGGEATNPSWEACEMLPRTVAGLRVETLQVPCEFRAAIEVVAEAIERLHPSLVVCVGQAGGRTHVSVERIAINLDDARIADNAGAQPIDEAIAPNGPAAYFATLPIKAMVAAMRAKGVPAVVSNSAGTFVCNHLMYGVLHYLAASGAKARAGFIHVPYSEAQVVDKPGTASMSIATMASGIEAGIAAAHAHAADIRAAEGALA